MLLATHRMDDRRLELDRKFEELAVRAGAARSAQQGDSAAAIQEVGELANRTGLRNGDRGPVQEVRRFGPLRRLLKGEIARQGDDRHTALAECRPDRRVEQARQLLDARDQLAEMTALAKEVLGMRFLEIAGPDFRRGNMGGNGQHRNARAVAVEQAVNEVKVPRPAAPRANREIAGEMSLSTGSEGSDLFVPDQNPLDGVMTPDRIGEGIEAVADDPEDPPNAGVRQPLHQLIGDGVRHACSYGRHTVDGALCFRSRGHCLRRSGSARRSSWQIEGRTIPPPIPPRPGW